MPQHSTRSADITAGKAAPLTGVYLTLSGETLWPLISIIIVHMLDYCAFCSIYACSTAIRRSINSVFVRPT
jgi:hypothetical protein